MTAARGLPAAITLTLGLPARAADPPSWGVQLFVGVPWNARTPLTIRQDGEPDLHVRARWTTRPLERPFYYGVGVFRRSGGHEWSGELIHHKIYLANPPAEVQQFSVSHGYNLLLLGHGVEVSPGVWARGALGAVVAHPESIVRGRELRQDGGLFGSGYHLAGPAASLGLEGRVPLGDRARLALGGRIVGGYAEVPVEGGSARVPNLAFHATAGFTGDVFRR